MHHKAYYRTVNGKVVHVGEGGEGQGRPAELHERTAIGKHKSGTHYLRASDAEDGSKIKRAADELGIHTEKRRAGANHFGRVGAYDHYHTSSLQDAQAIHSHLRRAADARHTEPDERPRGAAVSDRDDQSDERGGKVAPTDSRTAFNHTSEAQVATDEADRAQTPEAHEAAAEAHKKAENAHFAAQRTAENEQDGDIHQIARGGHASNATRHEAEAKRIRRDKLWEGGAAAEATQSPTDLRDAAYAASEHAGQGHGGYPDRHRAAAEAHRKAADANSDDEAVKHIHERHVREHTELAEANRGRKPRAVHAPNESSTKAVQKLDSTQAKPAGAMTLRDGTRFEGTTHDRTKVAHAASVHAAADGSREAHAAAAELHNHAASAHDNARFNRREAMVNDHHGHDAIAAHHRDAARFHRSMAVHGTPTPSEHGTALENYDSAKAGQHTAKVVKKYMEDREAGRPMHKAIIEAQFNHLDRMKTKVGGDPVALAALELRRAAIANQTEQE